MQPLQPKDLWPLPVYEGVRDQFRREVIEAKKDRRITVGPFMTFVFENRLTVKFQVQEILRAERMVDPEQIREELEGFNSMLPAAGELSATLLIELSGPDREVKAELAKLTGLGDHIDISMQMQADEVLADRAQRPAGQPHLAALDVETGATAGFGDVAGTDRAEELSLRSGLRGNGELEILHGRRAVLRGDELLTREALELDATSLETGDVVGGRERGLALGQQEVAAVSGADFDSIADVAEVSDLLQQNDFHGTRSQC